MEPVKLNYLAILAAALSNMVIGVLWYGPLFGKQWKELMGFTDESVKSMPMKPAAAMIGGFVIAFLMSYVLAHELVYAGSYNRTFGIITGLSSGFWNWLGFVVPVTAGVVLWEGKPWKLWALNASYWLIALYAMGVILAVWK